MNLFEILWELISSELYDTDVWTAAVVGFVIATTTVWLCTKFKQWGYRIGLVVMGLGAIMAEFNWLMGWNYDWLYHLTVFLVFLPALLFLSLFLSNRDSLDKVQSLCEQHSYVEALELLDTINVKQLTAGQTRSYQKRRFLLLVYLGSLRKAKKYLRDICPEQGAFYHFALHILAYYSGDLKKALLEIQAAEDSNDLKEDPFLQFQITMNHGVCYAAEANYHLADQYYRKALKFFEDKKIHNDELLETCYYNFAFNCLRLDPTTTDWNSAVEACQSKLDMDKVDAKIRMLNLRLELSRQTDAPRETIDVLLQETFRSIMEGAPPLKNQIFFAASAARVAWAAQSNPIPYLNFLSDNLSDIEKLPSKHQYQVYADLDILFRDLHGPAKDSLEKLRAKVSSYLKTEADHDLQQWQNSLPEEAIHERCDCLKKRAALWRNRSPYNRDNIVGLQENAIRLYRDNELNIDEIHSHQDIIDELLDLRNRDEDYRPVCINEIRKHLSETEELMSRVAGHPGLVEIYLRIGSYYMELDEYGKAVGYLRQFKATGISVQNFAPWLRRYYALLLLQTRVILFDQAIKDVALDKRLHTFGQDIQDWFSSYPRHDGELDTLLLGRFLSVPVGKIKIWLPNGDGDPQAHTWLWIPDLKLNVDLTYPQFTDDQLCPRIFFAADRHPFESGTSLTLQTSQQISPLIFGGVILTEFDANSAAKANLQFDMIYDLISSHIPEDCPTMEEFLPLIQEFIRPVPIPT